MSKSKRSALDCPQCELHYEAHFPALDFAFSSVGLSRGTSKEDTARAYFRSFHGRGHRGALWDALSRSRNDAER